MYSSTQSTGLPILFFSTARDFEQFLDREHATTPGIHLKFAKKSSGVQSITASEAVETALCFGWIDGRANRIDTDYWMVRYTPRRAKSIWSQKNVNTVTRLQEEGRMRPAGLAVVEAAKADGRWDRAYAGPATITVPNDLETALAAQESANTFFQGLSKSDRYAVLWRIETAPPRTRASRISSLVQMLSEGRKLTESVKGSAKAKCVMEKNEKLPKRKAKETTNNANSPSVKVTYQTRRSARLRLKTS